MHRPIIVNAEPEGYSETARASLAEFSDLRNEPLTRRELIPLLLDADGLIVRLGHKVDKELLTAAPRLKFVATATTGLNHVDLVETTRRGIAVLSLKGETEFLESITATAELTWGLVISLVRSIPTAVGHCIEGGWDRSKFKGRDLSDMTLGIIGYGRIGRMVGRYGNAFRMRLLAVDPNPISRDPHVEFLPMQEVLSRSDVVCVHASLESNTVRLLGSEEFSLMKAGAFLVNTARGEIVDESALLAALESGRLGGAALDVLANEIPSGARWHQGHPIFDFARRNRNLLLTPHVGGATTDSMRKTEEFMASKIKRYWERLISTAP